MIHIMEEGDDPANTCGICKVTYATDIELEDHNWSLMHHIKIEKIKKGAPHSCNLCMESCANIIEYGKHLNEDRHKLALSRRAKEGTELLDSFASQGGLMSKERAISPEIDRAINGPGYLQHMENEFQGQRHQNFHRQRGQGHARSFSQPDLYTEKPPYLLDINPYEAVKGRNIDKWSQWVHLDQDFNKNHWTQPDNEQPGKFKVPHGRPGHTRTHSDMRQNYPMPDSQSKHNQKNLEQDKFFYDDFQDINWNDNSFYNEMHAGFANNPYRWHRNDGGQHGRNERGRRGSFDSNNYRNSQHFRNDGRQDLFEADGVRERGRRSTRKNKGAGRAHSYDNNSPESTSSSDSGLKRRLEIDDSFAPGKSRRRYGPDSDFPSTSSPYRPDVSNRLIDDKANQRPRSRSASRDRYRDNDLERFDTDRPSSRNSDKKVSWSDQQQVSSTTESVGSSPKTKRKSGKGNKSTRSKSPMLPDSSSESELTKTSKTSEKGKKKSSGNVKNKTSPRQQRKNVSGDSTESVLEKAEKLCKKLRNEREKAKQKKHVEEKKKKFDKEKELNDKIETLSERNKANITGVLDAEMMGVVDMEMPTNDFFKLDGTEEYSLKTDLSSSGRKTVELFNAAELDKTQLIPERLVTGSKTSPSTPLKDSVKGESSSKSISDRIAQTKADIDTIRAKIESSVKSNLGPGNKASESPLSPSRQPQSQTEASSSHGRYMQPSDRTSLLKMVNSPRTTKERNQLAQMLREHAKSQKKLSLPRFNLKFSDLCSDSDHQDEQVNIDTLAPHVQLEIANIIEADVKPDIVELEKLLDLASAGNEELDMNILSHLGVSSPSVGRVMSPSHTKPLANVNTGLEGHIGNESISRERVSSPSLLRAALTDRRGYLHEQQPRERSRSPVSQLLTRENFSRSLHENNEKSGEGYRHNRSDKEKKTSVEREFATRDKPDMGQTLNMDDLTVSNDREKRHTTKTGGYEMGVNNHTESRFASSLPVSSTAVSSTGNLSASVTLPSSNVRIKQEVPDDSYEQAVRSALAKAKTFLKKPKPDNENTVASSETPTENKEDTTHEGSRKENIDSRYKDVGAVQFSPVRKSIHTQNLYRNEEHPVRDSERYKTQQAENDDRTTLEKVTSILDGVPAPRVDSGADKSSSATPTEAVPPFLQPIEKQLDSSQHSQASILDEVYSVSIQEENVRQEISTVDFKISKLKSLIDEASQELQRCSQEKVNLVEQEKSYRTKRLLLLEESRSSSACSQTQINPYLLNSLTKEQLDNPVLVKFLMSQRQSDLSSVGGYSNVESGSQPDSERNPQRRGSLTSNISEPMSFPATNQESNLFSKSIEAVSGSSDISASVSVKNLVEKSSVEQKQNDNDRIKTSTEYSSINSTNSISMLNKPLDKVGFVTLDALMKGDGDIGKLLNKSLESIEKGTIPEGASPLHKQSSSESKVSSGPGQRERRDSTFSLDTGSDSEKKSVSLKYMGTLPEGTNYESLVRQVSQDNKNKPLMITLFSSPEAMSQLRKTPDAGSTPVVRSREGQMGIEAGYKSDGSSKTNSTRTLTHMSDMESQSAMSNFSLGEQIKRMCDGYNSEQSMEVETPRAEHGETVIQSTKVTGSKDSGIRSEDASQINISNSASGLRNSGDRLKEMSLSNARNSPVKDCYVKLEKLEMDEMFIPKSGMIDAGSPIRKRLKSKKERDQMSRRKQKESFILQSDTNSEGENESHSLNKFRLPARLSSKSEEDLVQTGSEDRTPRPVDTPEMKRSRSLLDEVQLETETPSDSCEDRSNQKQSVIHYRGPSLSVAVVQEFKGDLYACYNGSEIRRFELKTGRILKELDCSPYLVNCLHVTSIEGRGDVLYTGGTCKKLLLFEPQKFSLITTFDYTERITCFHENWGRLFVGLSDGGISVRSLKTDKELNYFTCATSVVSSLGSSSAGMTKMLCLATADKVIYVLDAITGLLITMLEGHTQAPRCLQVYGENVISGGSDKTLMVHSITTGELCKMNNCSQAVTHIWCDSTTIYTASCDHMVRTYNHALKAGEVLQTTGRSIVTCGIVKDKMVIVGKRDGGIEAMMLDKLHKLTFKDHILSHLS